MPTFFIDLQAGDVVGEDVEGLEAADLDAVRQQAVQGMVDLAREQLPSEGELQFTATVRDSTGAIAFKTTLKVTSQLTRVVPGQTE
jgi:hypothetical protein